MAAIKLKLSERTKSSGFYRRCLTGDVDGKRVRLYAHESANEVVLRDKNNSLERVLTRQEWDTLKARGELQ